MGCAQSNQSKDGIAKAGASHDDVALVESRAAAAKFYEKQLAERDARITALERMLKEKGVAVAGKKKKPAVKSKFNDALWKATYEGDLAKVEALLAKGANAKAVNKFGSTLHYAAEKATRRSSTRCSHTAPMRRR